jgi:hypothetical protein
MASKVHFDFAAADELSRQLSQLVEKLDWLVWLRDTQRRTLLGDSPNDRWKGKLRDRFDHDFGRERARLVALKEQALSAQTAVHDSIIGAHAAQKAAEKASH